MQTPRVARPHGKTSIVRVARKHTCQKGTSRFDRRPRRTLERCVPRRAHHENYYAHRTFSPGHRRGCARVQQELAAINGITRRKRIHCAAMKLPTSITYDVKGNKVRYAAAAAPVYAVGDLDAQQVYAIDDGQKSYEALGVKPAPNAKAPPTQTVQKSGKVETIAGLTCEDWTIADGVEKVDVCASKGIEYFDLASDAKTGSTEAPWAVALTTEKAFPLRVVVRDKAGKEEYRAEATRADRKKLDDALFQLPSAYKKADLAKETKLASLP